MWAVFVAFGLLVCAVPALAAEIVEVRIGKHPTFTRVVFELDRAAGYRIERSDPSMDVAELIVSLEASSAPRSISKKKALIEQVDVEPNGRRSVARVRLSQEGLRLKEMILANPPRIVLDLLNEAPTVAEAKPAPAPPPAREEQAFEEIVAGIEPEEAPQEIPEPLEEKVAFEDPEPAPVVLPEPSPEPLEVAAAEIADDAEAAIFEDDSQTAAGETLASDSGNADAIAEEALAGIDPDEAPAPQKPAAQPKMPRPMVAKTTPEKDGTLSVYAMAGGAVLLLASGAFFLLRGRRASSDDEEWDDDDEVADDAVGFGNEDATAEVANPFARPVEAAEEQAAVGGSDAVARSAGTMDDYEPTIVTVPGEEKESESVVFDSEEKDMDDMEVISREQVNESLGAPAMPPVGGVASEGTQAMFAEMTRRMEALEARCDELVDARDRLERQVAAQTEELRVQRAAIARTQRAVRNLGRSGEGAEESEATEPALREPKPE